MGGDDVMALRALWQAVIMQAILDANANPNSINNKAKREQSQENKVEATAWIDINNKHFLRTCEMADINAEIVHSYFIKKTTRKAATTFHCESELIPLCRV